jgi:hypothetical protein
MMDTPSENGLESTICSIVKQAGILEEDYKEMLLQGNEVDIRIKLWEDAIEICKIESTCMSRPCIR